MILSRHVRSGLGLQVPRPGSRFGRCSRNPISGLDYLDDGEREAIALAEELKADQLLLDETDARKEAARRNLPFIGTLGILRQAAELNLISLPSTLARLQQTTFYADPALIQFLLDEDAQRRKP